MIFGTLLVVMVLNLLAMLFARAIVQGALLLALRLLGAVLGVDAGRTGHADHVAGARKPRHRPGGEVTDDVSDRAVARRTGMSFQRTRMSADRTLMSVIRTSLSLIGFGFTIFQVFEKAQAAKILASADAPRNFGIALVLLGIGMLALGIVYHLQFMRALRRRARRWPPRASSTARARFPRR
jgi:putative membrane protein